MADDTATPAVPSTIADPTATVDGTQPDDLGEAGKRALAQERAAKKAAEKQVSDLAKRLQDFEDRDKSEAQKLAERFAEVERERDALRVESIRARVAIAKGVPADLIEFLTASTEEDLAAQADRLLTRLAATAPPTPRSDADQGARGSAAAMPLNGDPIEAALRKKLGIT